MEAVDAVAPGFASSVTHRDIVGPHQMQEEYGLVGGNIFHGELSPSQLFHMRPDQCPVMPLSESGASMRR